MLSRFSTMSSPVILGTFQWKRVRTCVHHYADLDVHDKLLCYISVVIAFRKHNQCFKCLRPECGRSSLLCSASENFEARAHQQLPAAAEICTYLYRSPSSSFGAAIQFASQQPSEGQSADSHYTFLSTLLAKVGGGQCIGLSGHFNIGLVKHYKFQFNFDLLSRDTELNHMR